MSPLIKLSALAILQALAGGAVADAPPRLEVAISDPTAPLGSHVHNYERFRRDDVTYLVSGGGGARPVPVLRMFGELSKIDTAENFHYIRFRLEGLDLHGAMVRYEPGRDGEAAWTEPDRFEVQAGGSPLPRKTGGAH